MLCAARRFPTRRLRVQGQDAEGGECPASALEAVRIEMRAREEALNEECAFFFADANFIRALEGELPVFQEMRRLDKLTEMVVKLNDVVCAKHSKRYLAVSHR